MATAIAQAITMPAMVPSLWMDDTSLTSIRTLISCVAVPISYISMTGDLSLSLDLFPTNDEPLATLTTIVFELQSPEYFKLRFDPSFRSNEKVRAFPGDPPFSSIFKETSLRSYSSIATILNGTEILSFVKLTESIVAIVPSQAKSSVFGFTSEKLYVN